ncbi:MAG: large subunit ribosomal protein L25, partial [Rhodospirillaceae bacterium]
IASPGVKRGGVLNLVEHAIEVIGQPSAIPSALEIDVTGLKIGDSIHLSQVKLPEGVRLFHPEPDLTVATVVAPTGMKAEEDTTEESGT